MRPKAPKTVTYWAVWINYKGEHKGSFFPYCDPVPKLFSSRREARIKLLSRKWGKVVRFRVCVD